MHIDIHTDLDAAALERAPVARRIGPFASREFLRAAARFSATTVEVIESALGSLPIERVDDVVRLAGDPDLTDYHSPLGDGIAELVAGFATALPSGTRLEFDSLPDEAAIPLQAGLQETGVAVTRDQHEVAAVLDLPASFDDYLADLSKKQRHEVRRKNRRFTEIVGAPRLVRESGPDVVAMFADLHRRSSGEKGSFMTEEMEGHFVTLEKHVGGVVDVLYGDAGTPVAAAFGFEDDDTFYLYNSAYEPDAADASPGIVLVAVSIETAIERGQTRFDFLKGDEVYKFRLGATERPLFRLRGTT